MSFEPDHPWSRRRVLASAVGVTALATASYTQLPVRAGLPAKGISGSQVIGQSFPFKFIDPSGRVQVLEHPPRRVVSGILAADEILSMLIGNDLIASVTHEADNIGLSNAAGYFPRRIYRNHLRVEELISLEPDLLIVRDLTDASTVQLLMSAGIPLLRFAFYESFSDIDRSVRIFGRVLGSEDQASGVLKDMWSRLSFVAHETCGLKRPRVLWHSVSGSTTGEGTLNDETIIRAGGSNVVRDTGLKGYVKLSPEFAIGLQPDVILLDQWPEGEATKRFLMNSRAWRDIPAVKGDRIYVINSAWATTGTPFRVRGVESIAKALFPQVFVT